MAQQPNMNKMLKQLQQAQAQMAEEQEKLKTEIVEASAGGGMVTVKITGDQQITEVTIDPQAVDPEDVEMLQDMVLAATNEAIRSSQALAEQRLGGIAGGLGLPGM
jgi:DNA-binding YbaB/EbfC family protein